MGGLRTGTKTSTLEPRELLLLHLSGIAKQPSVADLAVKAAAQRVLQLLRDTMAKGIRKEKLLGCANEWLIPPLSKALLSVPEIADRIPQESISNALESLHSAYALAQEVDKTIDLAELAYDPNMQMAAETTDLYLEVARCIFLWPQSTVSREGARSRITSLGNFNCKLCHRPSQLYAHWYGMKTADAGLMIGTRRTTERGPDERLSAKYCSLHTKGQGLRDRNSGRYSAAIRKRLQQPQYSRSNVTLHLQQRGLVMPHSVRIPDMLAWMLASPTIARREAAKWVKRFPDIESRIQRTINSIFGATPEHFALLEVSDDLLEICLCSDGELQRVSADGTTLSQRIIGRKLDMKRSLTSLRRQFPIGDKRPVETAWSEDLGLEIGLSCERVIRVSIVSPIWLTQALKGSTRLPL